MGHARFAEPLSIRSLTLTTALLTSSPVACSIVDDEPPTGGGVGDTEPDDCAAQLEEVKASCRPGMSFESMIPGDGGGGSLIHIDDPDATVDVGPDAWLVQVGSAANCVGAFHIDDAACTACCGWCKRGESVCHQGLDESGTPVGCLMCLPYGTPDPEAQCATFMNACVAVDEPGADDGDDADQGDSG